MGMPGHACGLYIQQNDEAFCGITSISCQICHHVLALPSGKERKLNAGAQPQTFSYPMLLKSFLYANSFRAKSLAEMVVQNPDRYTLRPIVTRTYLNQFKYNIAQQKHIRF